MEYKKDKRTKNLTLRDIHVGDWVQVWSEATERYSPPLKIVQICDDGTVYLVTSDEERPTPWEEDIAINRSNTLLEYKAKKHGVNILRIGRFEPSSKMCTCGYINHNLTLSMRSWKCPVCGVVHDRDLLAANNIKRFALNKLNTAGTAEIQACGDMAGGCSGQPTKPRNL